jgi:hypothetical protein
VAAFVQLAALASLQLRKRSSLLVVAELPEMLMVHVRVLQAKARERW